MEQYIGGLQEQREASRRRGQDRPCAPNQKLRGQTCYDQVQKFKEFVLPRA